MTPTEAKTHTGRTVIVREPGQPAREGVLERVEPNGTAAVRLRLLIPPYTPLPRLLFIHPRHLQGPAMTQPAAQPIQLDTTPELNRFLLQLSEPGTAARLLAGETLEFREDAYPELSDDQVAAELRARVEANTAAELPDAA